jgi:hypothetical protein
MPETPLSATALVDALANSTQPAAQRAAEMLRLGQVQATTTSVEYGDLIGTLRARRDIKRTQAASGERNVVALRDALEAIIGWWDANPKELVLYDSLTTDSAVSFIFWRQAATGIVLAGFETRDATKLSENEGRAFWGPDWRPPYTGD